MADLCPVSLDSIPTTQYYPYESFAGSRKGIQPKYLHVPVKVLPWYLGMLSKPLNKGVSNIKLGHSRDMHTAFITLRAS